MLECSGSPKAPSTSRCALIDAALTLYKLTQRFGNLFVCQRIPQHAGPFRPGSLINLCRVRSAANDCGKRVLAVEWADPLQPQRLVGAFQSTIFSHPPCDEVEHRAQIPINRVPLPAGLAVLPSIPQPHQVLPQCLVCIGYILLNRFFQSGRGQPKIERHSVEICHCQQPLFGEWISSSRLRLWRIG